MTKYEELIMIAEEEGLEVIEKSFESSAKGLCKGKKLGISSDLQTSAEKRCVLAEELGHARTTTGNILDQSEISNQKQEHRARGNGFETILPLKDILALRSKGVTELWDAAEQLDVTEDYLKAAIPYYLSKHGKSSLDDFNIRMFYIDSSIEPQYQLSSTTIKWLVQLIG